MRTYARIRRLSKQRGEDMDKTLGRLGELLRDARKTATVRCTILVADEPRHWTLELEDRACRVHREAATKGRGGLKRPDLQVITRETTWWEIADGGLSPLEAFTQGRLRILGDTELGVALMRHLADGDGAVSLCGG
jgi:hypothetical protein